MSESGGEEDEVGGEGCEGSYERVVELVMGLGDRIIANVRWSGIPSSG